MSRITPVSAKKRKLEEAMRGKTGGKPKKRIKKQKAYHSSSEDEPDEDAGFAPVNLGDSDEEPSAPQVKKQKKQKKDETKDSKSKSTKSKKVTVTDAPISSDEEVEDDGVVVEPLEKSQSKKSQKNLGGSDSDSDSDAGSSSDSDPDTQSTTTKPTKKKSKRNDPEAFSTSITKILSTKLPTSVRHDPVLSRSLEATKTRQDASNDRLETKARAKLRAEKQAALQKGRTKDVLGIERGIAGEVAEKEKALRKIAQRGVIQLFNAFRAAHVRAEEARKEERKKGTVGMGERERKVNEVSKEGFLELIGGKKKQDSAAVSAGAS